MDKHPMRAKDNLATFDDFVEDLSNIDLSEQFPHSTIVKSARYLGIHINEDLNFKEHIKLTMNK